MCENCCCEKPNKYCCEKPSNYCCEKPINCYRNPCVPDPCCRGPVMDDCLAKRIECIWKECFCDAMILPIIGMPSCNNCVMTLTHSLNKCPSSLKINGLPVKSILANNSFYSAEVSCGKWVNLYKILIPDVKGQCGCKSSAEIYTEALCKFGISVDGDGYDFKGSCPHMLAINSKAIGMDPCEFSKKQIAAIKCMLKYLYNQS